jgi:hypothetical protein
MGDRQSLMSALGQKQTFAPQKAMSALPPIATAKADIQRANRGDTACFTCGLMWSPLQSLYCATFASSQLSTLVKKAASPLLGIRPAKRADHVLCFSESAIVCLLVDISGHAVSESSNAAASRRACAVETCSRSAMSAKTSSGLRDSAG